ncbi:D-glycero-beta-D-manno-heptose 1,7-bisphosphate 7-phosphatase [bacterium]|nr:D-glycero-beta-D-manno-heptose 1,7-bisphosphate 7-phosphatase [bacterium]
MVPSAQSRAVFLDRDGVLMEDSNYVGRVERVTVIPGVPRALKRLQDAGFRLLVVTNQSGVGRGYFPRPAVDQIHAHLDAEFGRAGARVDRYYVCPHRPDAGCDCRKPQPRFLVEAAREFGLDLGRSYMVGDRPGDIQAGLNAGTRTVLVLTGAGRETLAAGTVQPSRVVADLSDAADWILAENGGSGR